MSNELNKLIQQAGVLLRDGHLQKALSSYREVCTRYPDDHRAWQMAGVVAGMLGNFTDSVYCCEQAIKLEPNGAVYANYGKALMALERPQDALDAFRHAVEFPNADAACFNNMGVLYRTLGDDENAEACFRKAIDITPALADARINLAAILNNTGRAEEAVSHCRETLSGDPNNPGAFRLLCDCIMDRDAFNTALVCLSGNAQHFSQAAAYFRSITVKLLKQERFDEAGSVIEAALQTFPDDGIFKTLASSLRIIAGSADEGTLPGDANLSYPECMILANKCMKYEKYQLAEKLLLHACEQAPDQSWPHILLSRIAIIRNQHDAAIRQLQAALQKIPESAELLVELGRIYNLSGERMRAMDTYKQAITANPDDATPHDCLGTIHRESHNYADADRCYQEALRLDPESHSIRCNLALLYCDMGKYPAALDCCNTILEKAPDYESALAGKAITLERMGQCKPAYDIVAGLVESGSRNVHTLLAYARASPEAGKEAEAATLLEAALTNTRLPLQDRLQACFSLGKLHDRLHNYEKAFHYYKSGNDLSRDNFGREAHRQFTDKVIECFTADAMNSLPRSSNTAATPLFIVGMPRSGTTLVEQILSTHPAVYGAGELKLIQSIASSIMGATGTDQPFPLNLNALSTKLLDHFSSLYLQEAAADSDGEPLVTDKMPFNFFYLGLIELLFPGARIIHCVRDPLDTCLSCYFQQFKGSLFFSQDLSDAAFYYNTYRTVMAHWKSILKLPLLDVVYEETVADQEKASRRIIEFAGLDWHPGCLDFHKTGRTVKTASYYQVRKPMYQSSVGRWKHYEPYLAELIKNISYP